MEDLLSFCSVRGIDVDCAVSEKSNVANPETEVMKRDSVAYCKK